MIDEVDSFPYVNNKSLQWGARQSVKEKGVTIYLTAMPDEKNLRRIKTHELTVDYLLIRFH